VPEKELLKPIYHALTSLKMPDERIEELTEELRKIRKSESEFHRTNMDALKQSYDLYENRIGKMYDDKLDGSITEEDYDKKLKEYKEKQADVIEQMQEHSDADKNFYLTANAVFNLGKRAVEIFESSEVDEKRQLLGYLLQNCTLSGRKLGFTLQEPFNLMVETKHQPIEYPR